LIAWIYSTSVIDQNAWQVGSPFIIKLSFMLGVTEIEELTPSFTHELDGTMCKYASVSVNKPNKRWLPILSGLK
jgi:hypothetical protein